MDEFGRGRMDGQDRDRHLEDGAKAIGKQPTDATLLDDADRRRLEHKLRSVVEALSMPELSDIDFDPPRSTARPRAADFS